MRTTDSHEQRTVELIQQYVEVRLHCEEMQRVCRQVHLRSMALRREWQEFVAQRPRALQNRPTH